MSLRFIICLLLVLLPLRLAAAEGQAGDPLEGPFALDAATGFAINGFDPVGYFVEGRPLLGHNGLETRLGGAYWRFANEGNLAAFRRDPAVFAPRFGGFCVVAISRGAAAAGNPEIFAVYENQLYLFYSEGNRQVFLRDPEGVIGQANRRWEAVRHTVAW